MDDKEFERWIRSAPLGFEDVDYDEACRRLAKMYLTLLEEGLKIEKGLLATLKRRFPHLAVDVGQMTGFMHGWAFNAARKIAGLEPAPNPALLQLWRED